MSELFIGIDIGLITMIIILWILDKEWKKGKVGYDFYK